VVGLLDEGFGKSLVSDFGPAASQQKSKDIRNSYMDAATFSDQSEVRLVSRDGSNSQSSVRLFVTPELNETRTINYQEISEMRQAGGLLIYIGTQARTYSLTARFVSRTDDEARRTFDQVQLLKGWTVPNKAGSGGGIVASENAPEVLKLYGYGEQLRAVPVVITSLSIDYPAGVTYIEATSRSAFVPIIQTCTISLKEARNMKELEDFNLVDYKLGLLQNW
jgi:hypothetical protein